jgi:FkbM family methyltransferase
VDLYLQQAEVQLLGALSSRLELRSVIDVGAERGGFVEALLAAGATEIHAVEPEPNNATFLRTRFGDDSRVTVHECAVTAADGPVELRLSVDPAGRLIPYSHTLLELPDADDVAWRETVPVAGRSLASLVASGELPRRVGVLKVDTEGSDFAVVSALGDLSCDVVMIEHWADLPHSLGPCPWAFEDIASVLRPHGFEQFAFLEHRGEFSLLKWNDAAIGTGMMGNVVFLHDRVVDRLLPVVLESAVALSGQSIELGERYAAAAHARLAVIEQLEQAAPSQETAPAPPAVAARWKLRWNPRTRLHFWSRPRLGTLHHHDPKPLMVPVRYAATSPPMPAPMITVVTPSLQQGRFLERTLYSVLRQDYPALEYVVQDGGSTDETLAVLESFDGAITRWRSEPDSGQGDAINRGFRETRGEIMAWLNADDLLLPGALAYVARYFDEHPDVDVVYGHRIMIDEHDRQIGKWVMPAHDDRALTYADYVPQETLFWRRRIWDAVGGSVDTRFAYALDWDLLLRFQAAGAKTVRLPRYLGAFRVHPAQKTTAQQVTGDIECDVIRRRLHGRPVLTREAFERLKPYLVRSMLADMRQRAVDRLGGRTAVVETRPRSGTLRAN